MEIVEGKWKARNEREVEVKKNEGGYYAIIKSRLFSADPISERTVEDYLYYNDEGECYRDKRLNRESFDVSRDSFNRDIFRHWDLVELIEGKEEEIKIIKRNSNPIFLNPIDE